MNLMQLLLGSLTSDDSLKSASKKSGVSSETISKLLIAAVPLLINYLTQNASKKDGAESLLSALGQHTSTQTVSQQIKTADETDGAKIISHILGNDQNNVISSLAQQTNISTDQVNSVLNSVAPALLNSLSTATNATATSVNANKVDLSDGIDLSDIAGLLNGAGVTNTAGNQASGLLGSLLGSNTTTTNVLGSLLGGTTQNNKNDGSELLGLLTSLMK